MNPQHSPESPGRGSAVRIIAHRGLWRLKAEQNSAEAFTNAYNVGAGVETDLRDRDGELVISHDMPNRQNQPFRAFLESYKVHGRGKMLALNIKADGLQAPLQALLAEFQVTSYFVFDMSVPDLLGYRKRRLQYYTRESEYEPAPAAYPEAQGIWLDQFEKDWVDRGALGRHHAAGKQICIVSPELHGRPHRAAWSTYRDACKELAGAHLYLCTDHVEEAIEFFRI